MPARSFYTVVVACLTFPVVTSQSHAQRVPPMPATAAPANPSGVRQEQPQEQNTHHAMFERLVDGMTLSSEQRTRLEHMYASYLTSVRSALDSVARERTYHPGKPSSQLPDLRPLRERTVSQMRAVLDSAQRTRLAANIAAVERTPR
jgi:hypothetical protein